VPVHDLGYRSWRGKLAPDFTRWLVIAQTGIRLAWRSSWLRRLLLVAWLPAFYMGLGFFLFEQSLEYPEARRAVSQFLRSLPDTNTLADALGVDSDSADSLELGQARHQVWAVLLAVLFRYPQGLLMVLVVGVVAPPLIANDTRSRAFLLYFSRPLTREEYVLGKGCVVWAYLMMITTAPALVLYLLGVLLSSDLSVIIYTWDLPFRVLAATAVLLVPTTSVALCFSSMTTESRYATFGWFAIWIFGWVSYAALRSFEIPSGGMAGESFSTQWTLLSPYHTLGEVQSWVFGLRGGFEDVFQEAVVLTTVTLVSIAVLLNRVSAPIRA
jgi:hypothetical protein